ncbi:hypothetical protein M153_17200012728 [Pseudoloma neurophilia]|uniref:Uncharacterized protein n=1 Tax=Pseudoloma neurophilia TaxID=146866 RepID=A0A0R0LZJ4_9MICR|nr:hypothetical protein M153_17200012728 [Pseudoloma neurophilia]
MRGKQIYFLYLEIDINLLILIKKNIIVEYSIFKSAYLSSYLSTIFID